jgi:hypothetical protein
VYPPTSTLPEGFGVVVRLGLVAVKDGDIVICGVVVTTEANGEAQEDVIINIVSIASFIKI